MSSRRSSHREIADERVGQVPVVEARVVSSIDEVDLGGGFNIVAFEVLEHIEEHEKVLAEWVQYATARRGQ